MTRHLVATTATPRFGAVVVVDDDDDVRRPRDASLPPRRRRDRSRVRPPPLRPRRARMGRDPSRASRAFQRGGRRDAPARGRRAAPPRAVPVRRERAARAAAAPRRARAAHRERADDRNARGGAVRRLRRPRRVRALLRVSTDRSAPDRLVARRLRGRARRVRGGEARGVEARRVDAVDGRCALAREPARDRVVRRVLVRGPSDSRARVSHLRCVRIHTGSHTTPFAWWTPFPKDFISRRAFLSAHHPSLSIPDPMTPFNSTPDAFRLHPDVVASHDGTTLRRQLRESARGRVRARD